MSEVLIAGDLCPQDRISKLFENNDFETTFSQIKALTDICDYSIVNLEAPIVEGNVLPIQKAGPNICCSKNVIGALKYAGFDAVTLANNHFRDYGDAGVFNTINALNENNIEYVGGGKDVEEAASILYKELDEKKLAFVNFCEHEYSIAGTNKAGSNPLSAENLFYAIKEAKNKVDVVTVIIHGGIEHYQLPTPRMQKLYRFAIDCGADVVINHHQHCYTGYEIYNGGPIFYGLGNFCFDRKGCRKGIWNKGYMVKLIIEQKVGFELIPYIQCDDEPSVKLMDNDEKIVFEKQMTEYNSIITTQGELNNRLNEFVKNTWKEFDPIHIHQNRWARALYKRGLLPSFMSKDKLLSIQNKMNCESHLERLLISIDLRVNQQ